MQTNCTGVIIAGFGGQGILSAGKMLAYAGMIDNKKVSWFPSYGPEMRGGTANCHVVVSDNDIASPIVSIADALIAMSPDSFNKFKNNVSRDGIIIIDSSLVNLSTLDSVYENILQIPAIQLATEMGNSAYANVILLGALVAKTKIVSDESIDPALREVLPENKYYLIPDELKAFRLGWNLAIN